MTFLMLDYKNIRYFFNIFLDKDNFLIVVVLKFFETELPEVQIK